MSSKQTWIRCAALAGAMLVFSTMPADVFAQAGGRPLILDTQTGIHSGAGGTVLQTGPLNESGMVPARPLGSLPEVPQQGQQPVVISPYIEVQPGGYAGAQGYGISPEIQPQSGSAGSGRGRGLRSSGSHSGGLYGVPAATRSQAQPEPRSQQPTTRAQSQTRLQPPPQAGSQSRTQSQSSEQSRAQPRAQPIPAAPTSAATDPATASKNAGFGPKAVSRSSDPHTATGSVTSVE